MIYFVYFLKTIFPYKRKTYVGYTTNLKTRLLLHNSNKGAKATRGFKWKVIFKKKFTSKSEAMSYEYYLKKNRTLRKQLLINKKKITNKKN